MQSTKFWYHRFASGAALLLALTAAPAYAAVPATTVLEGTLNSAGGGPAADGTYGMTFAIYKDATGGAALWQEGPVDVVVKNGHFSYAMGAKVAIKPAALATAAWVGVKVAQDPELQRKSLHSVTHAVRAGVAEGLDCSGCVGALQLDPNVLAGFVKASDLSGYAKSSDLGGYAKTADLSAYAKLATLADVAKTGNYADLANAPNVAGFAKTADLHKVATTGSFVDLKDKPVLPVVGKACGTGLVVSGFKDDGSLLCVAGGAAGALPPDGIDEISNGLIFNQFTDTFSNAAPIPIPDAYPIGVSSTIVFPDVGVAQKLTVSVDIKNSDLTGLKVWLYDADNTEYILFNKGATGTAFKATFPEPTKTLTGDLSVWAGKNPKGQWHLNVIDSKGTAGQPDGEITTWSVSMQTLSNKKIHIKGDLIVDGDLKVGMANPTAKAMTYRWAAWSTHDPNGSWLGGNSGALFGGVAPSTWTDSNGSADQLSADKEVLRALFNNTKVLAKNTVVCAEYFPTYSSTNGRLCASLFRVKNTTQSDIAWKPTIWYSSYADWSETASAAINGANVWKSNQNCWSNCNTTLTFNVPKNRVSTVVVIASGAPNQSEKRMLFLAFYNDSMVLPTGLQFVDDFDTATGGWEQ